MRLGSKCAGPMTEAESPSGRPEIGGSGAPAPSTTRAAGGGGTAVAVAGPSASETVATLPDLDRSVIAESGLGASLDDSALTDPPGGSEAAASRPAVALM